MAGATAGIGSAVGQSSAFLNADGSLNTAGLTVEGAGDYAAGIAADKLTGQPAPFSWAGLVAAAVGEVATAKFGLPANNQLREGAGTGNFLKDVEGGLVNGAITSETARLLGAPAANGAQIAENALGGAIANAVVDDIESYQAEHQAQQQAQLRASIDQLQATQSAELSASTNAFETQTGQMASSYINAAAQTTVNQEYADTEQSLENQAAAMPDPSLAASIAATNNGYSTYDYAGQSGIAGVGAGAADNPITSDMAQARQSVIDQVVRAGGPSISVNASGDDWSAYVSKFGNLANIDTSSPPVTLGEMVVTPNYSYVKASPADNAYFAAMNRYLDSVSVNQADMARFQADRARQAAADAAYQRAFDAWQARDQRYLVTLPYQLGKGAIKSTINSLVGLPQQIWNGLKEYGAYDLDMGAAAASLSGHDADAAQLSAAAGAERADALQSITVPFNLSPEENAGGYVLAGASLLFGNPEAVGLLRSAGAADESFGVLDAFGEAPLAIPGEVASTSGAEQEAIVSNYLRDQFGSDNVGEQVRLLVTSPDGTSVVIKPDALVRMPDGTFQIYDAKMSFTKDLTTEDLTGTFSQNQRVAFPDIADGSATVQLINSQAGRTLFGDDFEVGKTIVVRPQINIFVNTPEGQVLRTYP